ncbi:hypothetical protein WN48_07632 [Eufriesea mexicana]|uniref:Uncharacterized protein n=1 Tax=Eufriesea mexicana TaxID=516756 RepID=A0A310SST4_9HYME|nr:hypothetical protein WN48_07632 [Eufriesea mexicana]
MYNGNNVVILFESLRMYINDDTYQTIFKERSLAYNLGPDSGGSIDELYFLYYAIFA